MVELVLLEEMESLAREAVAALARNYIHDCQLCLALNLVWSEKLHQPKLFTYAFFCTRAIVVAIADAPRNQNRPPRTRHSFTTNLHLRTTNLHIFTTNL
jgi:hypothetical protein